MDILLVTATMMEMRAAVRELPGQIADGALPLPDPAGGESLFHLPGKENCIRIDKCRLYLMICGIGPLNAVFSLGAWLTRAEGLEISPAGVINAGIAGTYDQQKLPVGSTLLAHEEHFPEFGLASGGFTTTEGFDFYQYKDADTGIKDKISLSPRSALAAMGLDVPPALPEHGMTTVSGCSATLEQAENLRRKTGALAENMEGFPLALACKRHSLACGLKTEMPFVEIRSISNAAGCRPPDTWAIKPAMASLGEAMKKLFT